MDVTVHNCKEVNLSIQYLTLSVFFVFIYSRTRGLEFNQKDNTYRSADVIDGIG